MTEFLTENARRAYPFDKPWPAAASSKWTEVFVDASVGYAGDPAAGISVTMLKKTSSPKGVTVQLQCGSDTCTVSIPYGCSKHQTVFGGNQTLRAMFAVNGPVLDSLYDTAGEWDEAGQLLVSLPVSMRCSSFASNRVKSIATYSAELCTTPLFSDSEEPIATITGGDVILAAKDGIDVESTTMLPVEGDIIRVSALAAEKAEEGTTEKIDIMLRGDDCFTVENYPGAKVVGGVIEKRTAEDEGGVLGGGVIRIGTKCKPCCQCEDYKEAFDALKPADVKAKSIKTMLDEAKALYETAVTAFNTAKETAKDTINSYDNVRLSVNGVPSGGLYGGSSASGKRRRVAITLTVANMTQLALSVGTLDPFFVVPGFSQVLLQWRTAGSNPRSRSRLPDTVPQWSLKPGDTLVVVATYAATGSTNDASVPSGSKVNISLCLDGKLPVTKAIDVK